MSHIVGPNGIRSRAAKPFDFGRDDDLIPRRFSKKLAEYAFQMTVVVRLGGIEAIDAQFKRLPQPSKRVPEHPNMRRSMDSP